VCGLAGLVLARGAVARREDLERMAATLAHRGPDGRRTWTSGSVGLAHARLAIIDLATGDQPLSNEDGTVWVAFNGEIYNYRELRAELAPWHAFRTRSDTEVLAHGWEEWGPALFPRLSGFFAIALWDARSERLVLARDRLGKKPLFFARGPNGFAFGSELRALLAWLPERPGLDAAALNDLLAVRHLRRGRSGLAGVEELLPGELLVLERGELRRERFWTPPPPRPRPRSEAEALAEYRALFDAAVARRLESEVPLGLLLSGGIDSTALLESLARQRGRGVRTFSVAFSRDAESEAPFARLAAEHFATEHEEFLLSEAELVDAVAGLLARLDEPTGDPSILPTALISRCARQRVSVCLTGDGGDELFAGYERYARLAHRTPRPAGVPVGVGARLARDVARALPRHAFKAWKLARALEERTLSGEASYVRSLTCLVPREREALLGERTRAALDLGEPERDLEAELVDAMGVRASDGADPGLVARAMHLDLQEELPGMILTKVDRASMQASLEVRSPFLDHELVEWAADLPLDLKVRAVPGAGDVRKWIVKRSLEGRVPPELLLRAKKGFGTPLGRWFRRELAPLLEDHLGSSSLARDGWLSQPELARLLAAHRSRARNLGEALWVLLALEVWYRNWVRRAS
jgi:asparagine synthase (glutamine-hydrolysing)